MQSPGLYKRLRDSFGYLRTKGYCAGAKCLKWPVLLGEFSAPHAGAPQVGGGARESMLEAFIIRKTRACTSLGQLHCEGTGCCVLPKTSLTTKTSNPPSRAS